MDGCCKKNFKILDEKYMNFRIVKYEKVQAVFTFCIYSRVKYQRKWWWKATADKIKLKIYLANKFPCAIFILSEHCKIRMRRLFGYLAKRWKEKRVRKLFKWNWIAKIKLAFNMCDLETLAPEFIWKLQKVSLFSMTQKTVNENQSNQLLLRTANMFKIFNLMRSTPRISFKDFRIKVYLNWTKEDNLISMKVFVEKFKDCFEILL